MNLKKILKDHIQWLNTNGKEGVRADLTGANLKGADLTRAFLAEANLIRACLAGANLFGANLEGADFSEANLEGANFSEANLRNARLNNTKAKEANFCKTNLSGAEFYAADLIKANFYKANLINVNLYEANLTTASLTGANLQGADLTRANLDRAQLPDYQLPQNVVLIGYKKVMDGVILKLEISSKTPRTASLIGNKCRAKSAKVLAWMEPNDTKWRTTKKVFASKHNPDFMYRVGETVTEPRYNNDSRIECTNGIHFFETLKAALEY
jgi:hypothetical protein